MGREVERYMVTRLKVLELAKLTIHAYEFNWRGRLGAVTQKLSR